MATKTENIILEFLQDIKSEVSDVNSRTMVIESEMKHKVDDITFVNDMTVFRKKMNDEVDDKLKCKDNTGVNWMKTIRNSVYLFTLTSGLSLGLAKFLL